MVEILYTRQVYIFLTLSTVFLYFLNAPVMSGLHSPIIMNPLNSFSPLKQDCPGYELVLAPIP